MIWEAANYRWPTFVIHSREDLATFSSDLAIVHYFRKICDSVDLSDLDIIWIA